MPWKGLQGEYSKKFRIFRVPKKLIARNLYGRFIDADAISPIDADAIWRDFSNALHKVYNAI